MNPITDLYAKSTDNGGTLLIEHLRQVASVADRIAEALNLDRQLIKFGGLLHDIGKAHPDFQKKLVNHNEKDFGIPFRHEIASLFFLPLFPKKDWGVLIDMIVAHHRSISQDVRNQGILDLENTEGIDELLKDIVNLGKNGLQRLLR